MDGQASSTQSFERAGGSSGEPEVRERIARVEGGLTLQTLIGAAVRLGAKLSWSRLPGQAGKKIEDVQLSYGFSANFKMSF